MRRASVRGLALFELVLVMILITLIAGLLVPRFSDFMPSWRVRTTARRMVAWLLHARGEAASTGLVHRFVYDPAGRRYGLVREARPFREPGVFEPLAGLWAGEELPEGVELSLEGFAPGEDGRRYLEFRPDGTARPAAVTLSNDRGDRAVVRVAGAAGRIFLERPEGPP
ncbi:MAG TPA: GspH/FimT family pseudopilin [Planctomycetota bacterium]|nr:GspH/FimT family pseudopilin [Planctomycetota bacterium]